MKARTPRHLAAALATALVMGSLMTARADPAGQATDPPSPFTDAVAVWHLANGHDSAGGDSALTVEGQVRLGVELQGPELEASLARGGDGRVAELGGGWLDAGLGAGGELNLTGPAMTICIRLRDPVGKWNRGIFSKYGGGHDTLAYNLFSVGLSGPDAGPDIGFELGHARRKGMVQVRVSVARLRDSTAWHDLIVRYDGRWLELFVDGLRVDRRPAAGDLRQNGEACIVGGYSVGGAVPNPFHGHIDHAALWQRALSNEEILQLSGGPDAVEEHRCQMHQRQRQSPPLAAEVERYRAVVQSHDRAEFAEAARALRRWMIAHDPFRPLYHFTGPESWINDPNGPIFFKGRYHLFYQHDPIVPDGLGGYARSIRAWGHAVSSNLVHWEDWPIAIWPDTPEDRAGVYSGNTFVDHQGRLCALYTGNVSDHAETYGILARSTNEFLTCTKQVVLHDRQRPNPESPVHWDGFVWKEGDSWCQLIGGTTAGRGAAWLWKSPDLERWTLQRDIAPTIQRGGFWELPYLIPLGGRHILLVGAGNPYWIGTYDAIAQRFTPDQAEPRSIDNGAYYSFNPNMADDKGPGGTPRRLLHGWATIGRPPSRTVPYWEHAHSIPRVITLRDGRVWQEPIPELQALRTEPRTWHNLVVPAASTQVLASVKGDALEILATCRTTTTGRFGLTVRASATDPTSGVPVWFDAQERTFGAGRVSMASDVPPGDPVTLHVFVDRCLIEVYVNGHANTVACFLDPAAQSVAVFSTGSAGTLERLDTWRMRSPWE